MTYTNRLKVQQLRELGLPGTPHDYHEDHLVPLCVGDNATDPRNLWPQLLSGIESSVSGGGNNF